MTETAPAATARYSARLARRAHRRRDRGTAERDRDAELARDALEEYATVLQRTLLPPTLPHIPALAVAAHYHPASASQVGGDFYEVFALGAADDVEGHGPAAAAVTSLAQWL